MSPLRIGMVGIGYIADRHCHGFKSNPHARITGMCHNFFGDPEQIANERLVLAKKCKEWNCRPFESFEELVVSPEIDALVVGSITPFHFKQVQSALANKKHVMVEKPVVTEYQQLKEINKLAEDTGCKIFPAHNFIYRQSVLKAKEALMAGVIGKIIHASLISTHSISEAHATGWRSKRRLASGGALMDSGHHLIYQSIYLLGVPAKCHAFASRRVLTGMECEDIAQVSLLYPDSSMGLIMQSWASDSGKGVNGIRIVGDKGNIVITDALYVNGEQITDDVDYANSFKNQATAFSNYVLKNIAPLSGLDDVRNTLKITYAAYESAERDRVITLQ
jgi:predicted dehydrogenase